MKHLIGWKQTNGRAYLKRGPKDSPTWLETDPRVIRPNWKKMAYLNTQEKTLTPAAELYVTNNKQLCLKYTVQVIIYSHFFQLGSIPTLQHDFTESDVFCPPSLNHILVTGNQSGLREMSVENRKLAVLRVTASPVMSLDHSHAPAGVTVSFWKLPMMMQDNVSQSSFVGRQPEDCTGGFRRVRLSGRQGIGVCLCMDRNKSVIFISHISQGYYNYYLATQLSASYVKAEQWGSLCTRHLFMDVLQPSGLIKFSRGVLEAALMNNADAYAK